jgi:hypothetical protein
MDANKDLLRNILNFLPAPKRQIDDVRNLSLIPPNKVLECLLIACLECLY